MLFDNFWCQKAKGTPKASINGRFYKVFWLTFSEVQKLRNATGIQHFFIVAIRHQFIVKNLMLLDDFGGHFAFWAPKWSKFNRFYKVFWSTFCDAPKRARTNAFSTFCKVVERHQLPVKNLMLCWYFWGPFWEKGSKSLHKRQVL